MFPWTGIDPSVIMAPPYSYPVPLPVPTGPIAMHPSLQSYPFFGNHNPGAIANPCSTFMPYSTTTNPPIEQPLHNMHHLPTLLAKRKLEASQWMTKEEVMEIDVMVPTMWQQNLN